MEKVLIIEDDADLRENTADILKLANYEVWTAENGVEGVEIAQNKVPDIIICDIMMPGLDGFGVLESLSKKHKTACIPFIFLSARSERADVRKGMNLGADDYLTKPFDEKELLDAITSRLHKHAFLKEEFTLSIEGINNFFEEVSSYGGMGQLSQDRAITVFEKKEIIYREGDAAHTMYFLQSGSVKTYKTTETGKSLLTGIFGQGQFIGQLSLLNNKGVYLDTAAVLERAEIFEIPKIDFITLLYSNKSISNKFIAMISNDIDHLQDQLVSMAFETVKQRLAKVLLTLLANHRLNGSKEGGIQISREDLAGLLGTATETAIRMLTDFKDEGIVNIGPHRGIIVTDEKRLKYIAEFG